MDIEDQNEPVVTNDEIKDLEIGTIRAENEICSKNKVGKDLVIQGTKFYRSNYALHAVSELRKLRANTIWNIYWKMGHSVFSVLPFFKIIVIADVEAGLSIQEDGSDDASFLEDQPKIMSKLSLVCTM